MSKSFVVLSPLMFLILALNLFGGVVAGVWLAILGEWFAIAMGIGLIILSPLIIGILLLPNMLLVWLIGRYSYQSKTNVLGFLAAGSLLYTSLIMALFGVVVLLIFAEASDYRNMLPFLLWSYTVASSPWLFLARKDTESGLNSNSSISTLFFQGGYIFAGVSFFISGSELSALVALGIFMLLNWLLQTAAMRADLTRETESTQNAVSERMQTDKSEDVRSWKGDEDTLHFKDTESAFEFSCRFERNELRENVGLPAIVLDARKLLGADDAVPIDEDGIQRAYLRVASDDGGFEVVGHAMSQNGPRLDAGDLVIWMPLKYIPELGKGFKDRRGGWAGAIIARLRPVRSNENGWAIDEHFRS